MSGQSSHRASFADDERPYRPTSATTSHSHKSSPRDSLSRPATHAHSHSAKDKSTTGRAASSTASPTPSRLRSFSSSTTSTPHRTSLTAPTTSHPTSQPASSTAHPLLLADSGQYEELKAAFQVFDRDGTGRVSTALILATLRSLPPHPSHVLLSSLLPSDGGVTVSFDDFVRLMTSGVEGGGGSGDTAGRVEWERVFALMDEGGKGWLDESDLERVRRSIGGGRGGGGGGSKSEVRAMLARADLNGDGVVSRDEFVALMMEDKLL